MVDKHEIFHELMKNVRMMNGIGLSNRNRIDNFKGGGQIIVALAQHDNKVCQNGLAKLVHVRPGSVSQVLARLERDGMIQRHRDQKDHRLVVVSLTDKGLKKYHQLDLERKQFINDLLSKLSIDDCQDLLRISHLMVEGLQENYKK